MAQIPLRIGLTNTGFPFLSDSQGRTVIIPGFDVTGQSTAASDPNVAVPEIYYGHNIVPTAQGFRAVPYRTIADAPSDTDNFFQTIHTLRDSSGNKAYLGCTSSGRNYILRYPGTGWIRTTDYGGGAAVTTAYVNGVTYIYYAGVGCKFYNFSTNALTSQTLTALTAADVLGIFASNGYMLAYTAVYVFWSSTIDPTDFTPSLVTGAGGGSVQDLKGIISCVREHEAGFVVYSNYNMIMGNYTNNIRFPFNFKEVLGGGGLSDPRHVAIDPVTEGHYSYTSSGLQLVGSRATEPIFPELTDFLAGLIYEDFDYSTDTFSSTSLAAQLLKRITSVADRYIVFSYGTSDAAFTYAIVFDVSLRRFGKLKCTHIDCFEYVLLETNAVDNARNSIGFLQADGTVYIASLSDNNQYAEGVVLLGKFQMARQNAVDLCSVEVENVRQDYQFSCTDLYSIDGKNTSGAVAGYEMQATGLFREYLFRTSGMNHSLLLKGAFDLTSVQAFFGMGGYR